LETQDFSESFILHFGKKEAVIASRILRESLIAISTAIEEINKTLGTGKHISIKVKAFEKGSFEVPFDLIEVAVLGVLNMPTISSIPDIIKILREFIDVKIKLKGTQPKEINETDKGVQLTSKNGDVYNISHVTGNLVLNNFTINDSFNKGLAQLTTDERLSEYSILDSNRKPIISIKPEEFPYFTTSESEVFESFENVKEKTKSVSATLRIHKVVFDTTSKWGFIYNNNKISAKIADKGFQEKVQKEGRFGKGDIHEVLMEIHQEFDETVGVFINKAYVIAEVLKHIPRPQQTSLC
jgi:hypothetical protein